MALLVLTACAGFSSPRLHVHPALRTALTRMNDEGVEYPVTKTDAEWREQLDEDAFGVAEMG